MLSHRSLPFREEMAQSPRAGKAISAGQYSLSSQSAATVTHNTSDPTVTTLSSRRPTGGF